MKKFIGYILLTLVLVSCGAESGHFRISGRLRNFNQGEFYVYSTDGAIPGLDTITVSQGRFEYDTPLDTTATFIIVFPNFSEHPVFGESGATAKLSGDASHLKEVEVSGTDVNEQMTEWRLMAANLTPPEVKREAEKFINAKPTSIISRYLLRKYFIDSPQPDYKKATLLAKDMKKANPSDAATDLLLKHLDTQKNIQVGEPLPRFSAIDINGKKTSNSALTGKFNIINVWASWNYESQNIQRLIVRKKKEHGNDIEAISICLDASIKDCRRRVTSDSIKWSNICNGNMWQSPILKTLGIATIPGNIICDSKGKIIARDLRADKIEEKIKEVLGKK